MTEQSENSSGTYIPEDLRLRFLGSVSLWIIELEKNNHF